MVRNILMFLVGFILLSGLCAADTDWEIPCMTDLDCQILSAEFYCNQGSCFEPSESAAAETDVSNSVTGSATATSVSTPTFTPTYTPALPSADTTELKNKVESLESQVSGLNTNIATVQASVSQLGSQIESISTESQESKSQLTQMSTGMAVLQEGLSGTEQKIDTVQNDLTKNSGLVTVLFVLFFGLLIGAVALGAAYFITRDSSDNNARAYIKHQLSTGKNPTQIKSALLRAGWAESKVDKHLKKSTSHWNNLLHNYDMFKILLALIVCLFLVAVFLVLGKGISFGQAVAIVQNSSVV